MKQNSTIKATIVCVAATLLLASCSSNYQKTASGLLYKITKDNGKPKLKNGQWAKFFVEYKLDNKDTVLQTNFGKMPGYFKIDSTKFLAFSFTEFITKLGEGDKAEFKLSIDTMVHLKRMEYNDLFRKGGMLKCRIEIVKVFTDDVLQAKDAEEETKKDQVRMRAEMEKEFKKQEAKNNEQMAKQKQELKDYIAKNKIKCIETASGVLVETITEGTGAKVDSGKTAKVLYRGSLLNGKIFDSNMDKQPEQLLPVIVGGHNVVPGFENGVKELRQGSKARIYIPAVLAYGDQDYGPIPANSCLIFEVEVKEVVPTEAPKTNANKAMNKANENSKADTKKH